MQPRTLALTACAMVAFAANSLLCRVALGQGLIDAASFTTVRVGSGALLLALIVVFRRRMAAAAMPRVAIDWLAVTTLFAYMVFFSFSYRSLSAGTGALILFGAVQLTMFAVALRAGERFGPLAWAGLALAVAGLVYLVSPGLAAPDPTGAALMAVAGIAWGGYSLRGRTQADPIDSTANSFIFSVPLVVIVSVLFADGAALSAPGLALAAASGALASALGYVVWYGAIRGLSAGQAATVQLSVPAITAFGGVLLLAEPVTLRLLVASAATLGGVGIVLAQRSGGVDRGAYSQRVARPDDSAALNDLIAVSAHGLSRGHYSTDQVQAALDGVFGVDSQLIADGTYYVIESGGAPVACGGWSFRATLFGSDAIAGRDPRRLDPKTEAAKIRAFFVHPEHARRGLGRRILQRCEQAARAAGFTRLELGATLPGQPFYAACGYGAGEPSDYGMKNGLTLTVIPMSKSFLTVPSDRNQKRLAEKSGKKPLGGAATAPDA